MTEAQIECGLALIGADQDYATWRPSMWGEIEATLEAPHLRRVIQRFKRGPRPATRYLVDVKELTPDDWHRVWLAYQGFLFQIRMIVQEAKDR